MAVAEQRNETDQLGDEVIGLVQTWYKLTLVTATKKSSGVAASLTVTLMVTVVLLMAILFGGIALGYWLGNILGNMALGHALTGLFFLIIALIIYASRKKMMTYVRNIIIRKIYE